MKPYDEIDVHCDGSVEGDRLKRNMIQNGLKIIFHPSVFYKLINELCIFLECYRDLLSDAKTYLQLYLALEAKHHKKYEVM